MASVTYNSQSFVLDGRRLWIVGASIDYARVAPEQWADRIADAAQAGFNTIETACPWSHHEPRRGKFDFKEGLDVAAFIRLVGEAGLRAVVRLGPYIGSGYEGGGIPAWLAETEGVVLRQTNEIYLERMGKYLRKLVAELSPLQASNDGPIVLVQGEHTWTCSNQEQVDKYLGEVTRMIRENGMNVPILSANDLWTDLPGTIGTWRGRDDMLSSVRQLRAVQPNAPRVVSAFAPTIPLAWGDEAPVDSTPDMVVRQLAEILAAGGQPIVSPFLGGTNFGFLAGQIPGRPGATLTTAAAPGAPLGESGERTDTYRALKRLVAFAGQFGHVFADLDPDYQPITLAPADDGRSRGRGFSIVPLRGGQGRVVFVFANGTSRQTTLLLDNGVRMPIDLGDQSVAWYLLDADLLGRGKLEYVNLCPVAIIDRSLVLLQGPKGSEMYLSVDGTTLQEKVPAGKKPLVLEHKGVTFVICNQEQIDVTYWDDANVYVGCGGLDATGRPFGAPGFAQTTVINVEGDVTTAKYKTPATMKRKATGSALAMGAWRAAPAQDQVAGKSPRYATLDGPRTLVACGAPTGYGWYRIEMKVPSTAKRIVHMPGLADRAQMFLDGESLGIIGDGPDAKRPPLELRLEKGVHVLTALLDNLGRPGDGCEQMAPKGLYENLYTVKPMKTVKPRTAEHDPVDPFTAGGFVHGLARGQLSDLTQVSWTFTHAKKAPLVLDISPCDVSGTFVLNGVTIGRFAGAAGVGAMRLLLSASRQDAFKRGKNELRFAPDSHQESSLADFIKCTTLYECVEDLTGNASWSFAKWEPPAESKFQAPASRAAARAFRGAPCWWKGSFAPVADLTVPLRIGCTGLSKGQLFVNGHNVGRYFTAQADGKAVGPQTELYVPPAWLHADRDNEVLVFDEHGFDTSKVTVVLGPA